MLVVALALASPLGAQGGPPLRTDDPGTPGPGAWEINTAITADHTDSLWTLESPVLDLNFGWGDEIQLNLELPLVLRTGDAAGTAAGLGNVSIAVKWRFQGSDTSPPAVSIYPRITFSGPPSALRHGLADPGTEFFFPIELAAVRGPVRLNPEVGFAHNDAAGNSWVAGLAVEHDPTRDLALLGEIHDRYSAREETSELVFDLGLRQRMTKLATLLFTAGRSLPGATDANPRFFFYMGVQVTS